MIVSAIPYEMVGHVWPKVKDFLERAVKANPGTYTIETVIDGLIEKEIALWVVFDDDEPIAAVTTRLIRYPTRMAMAIDWIGGIRMKEWLPMLAEKMDQYARDHGCKHIEGVGRPGWVRALEPYGYRKTLPTYRKELEDERG